MSYKQVIVAVWEQKKGDPEKKDLPFVSSDMGYVFC